MNLNEPDDFIEEEEWDFWRELGLHCCGYSSDSDLNLINVFIETSKENHWYADIAFKLNLDTDYVCLLVEILCSAGLCEYGTSPRSAWAVNEDYENNLAKLLDWYERKWNEKVNLNKEK